MIMTRSIFIIAEAGVNHNGRIELAERLVDAAADAGADAVKFQTFKAEKLVVAGAGKAAYQKRTTDADESQFAMIKKLELDEHAHRRIMERCAERSIMFLSTPFDPDSADMLAALGLPMFKIPSGEITNLPLLRHIGGLGRDVILSTGMATLEEVGAALAVLEGCGLARDRITVLHCNTEYPTPFEDVNLRAMNAMAEAFPGIRVGYSDHTLGIEAPIAAAALGATIIEKHFTLDRAMEGPDHKASLEPGELTAMVAAVRNIEKALGSGIKKPSASESRNRDIARKYIVAARPIRAGEPFTPENLTVKRIGRQGVSPMLWDRYIGTPASRDYAPDEALEEM